jgi:predicted RNA binding protein YcfA (HicA-like mRNA interferase family)
MTLLPLISGNECIKALREIGYTKSHTKGSHARLVCPDRAPVTVPLHAELDRGTLSSILRTVKISAEEFSKLLKR